MDIQITYYPLRVGILYLNCISKHKKLLKRCELKTALLVALKTDHILGEGT